MTKRQLTIEIKQVTEYLNDMYHYQKRSADVANRFWLHGELLGNTDVYRIESQLKTLIVQRAAMDGKTIERHTIKFPNQNK